MSAVNARKPLMGWQAFHSLIYPAQEAIILGRDNASYFILGNDEARISLLNGLPVISFHLEF
jgi:hypothetical protein